MKRRSLLDGYNTQNSTPARRSLLDGYTTEMPADKGVQVQNVPTAPVMSAAPKIGIMDKINSNLRAAAADYATREIKKRELWEQNHPILSSLQKEFDVTYGARHNNRQFLLDKLNGLNPNASEVALKNIKQSVRPAVNLATDIAVSAVAPQLVGAKYVAKASQAANIINKAKSAKRVADATKAMNRANFIKDASQVGTIGGVTGATHGLTQEVDEVMNNGKNISSDLITKPLLYGTAGAITGPTFGGANLAKQEAMRRLAPVIANNPVVKGVADALVGVGSATGDAAVLGALEYPFGVNQEQKDAGYTMLDHMGNYVKSPIPLFGLLNGFTPIAEAGVNKIRNTANRVKAGDRPELQTALEKLNKSSKDSLNMEQVEEIQNAQKLSKEESDELSTQFYTGKTREQIKAEQELAKEQALEENLAREVLSENGTLYAKDKETGAYTPKIKKVKNEKGEVEVQNLQGEKLIKKVDEQGNEYWTKDNSSKQVDEPIVEKPKAAKKTPEQPVVKTMPAKKVKVANGEEIAFPEVTYEQRKPEPEARTRNVEYRGRNKDYSLPGASVSNKNTKAGINTPKKDLIHVNGPSSNVREKIIKLPAVDKVAEGGDEIYRNVRQENQIKFMEGENLEVVEKAKKSIFDKWYREEFPVGENMKTAQKNAIEVKRMFLKTKKQKDMFEKYLLEHDDTKEFSKLKAFRESTIEENKGYSPNEKQWASSQWRTILKKKGSTKEKQIADSNKKSLVKKDVYNKDMYISGSLNQSKNKQGNYDKLYDKIVSQENVSPRLKELMVKQLNDNAKKFTEIQPKSYSAKETTSELKKQLNSLNEAGNTAEAGRLIAKNKVLRSTKEAKEHWEQSSALHSKNIDNLIKEGRYKEAKEELAKYKRIIKNDIRNSATKDRWASREVSKGTKPTELDDGRYTRISTDTQGRTWEYGPTGETYDFTPAGEGERLANERIAKWEAQISKGLNKKSNTVNYIKKDLNLASDYINEGKTFSADLKGKIKIKDLAVKNKELVDFVKAGKGDTEVKFSSSKGLSGAQAGFDFENNIIYINKESYDKTTLAHELQHAIDYSPEYKELYYQVSSLADDVKNFTENNKSKLLLIKHKKLSKQSLTDEENNIVKRYEEVYNAYANHILEKRAISAGIGKKPQTTLQEDLQYIKDNNPEEWEKYYHEISNISRTKEGDRVSQRILGNDKSGRTDIQSGKIANSIRRQEGLSVQDKEALKKAKFSDRQIKTQQKLSEANENKAIKLGILTQGGAAYRKGQLGYDVKWYAPQKHNPLKGEKVPQEADYWNDSKVGLFGKAEKELKERVTYADVLQNNYIRKVKVDALEEVDKVIRSLSKPIGKKGVDKGYVAVNRSMLNSLIYNNNSYDFFKLLTDPDNLKNKDTIKKVLSKDMSDAQAEWFALFAQNNRKPDYQIPEAVLKQALSFSKELASEQFHRYFEFPKSVGKQGSLKFLATASNAVLDAFLDNFKRTVLATPSFVVNNRLGNTSLIIANSKNNIDTLKGFADALKMKDTDIPVGLLDNSLNEAIQESFLKKSYTGWKEFDDFANLFNGHNIKSNEADELGKQATKFLANLGIALPSRWYNKYAKGIINVNTKFENFERKWASAIQYRNIRKDMLKKTGQSMVTTQEFIKHVKKHPELQSTVLEAVQNILGNYNDFTPAERNVIKKIVPFYSWWRTITNSTLQLAKDNPARLATVVWYMNNIKERDKDLKEFQRGSVQTGLKDSRSGKNLLLNKEAYAMPWETLVGLSKEDPVKGLANAVNPLLRVGAEAVTGKKFFGSGEITSKRYVQKTSKKTGEKYYWDTKEKKRVDSLPVSTRAGYAAKELGKNFVPYLSNNFIKGESLIQGALNIKKNNGKFLEPDKMYDADLGGWNKGDFVNDYKRYAANDSSQLTKTLARTGIGLQIQYPLNKKEKQELQRKQREYKEKRKKKD